MRAWIHGGGDPPSVDPEAVSRTGEPAVVAVRGPVAEPDDGSFWSLVEKPVSTGRSLDKRCYFHHTVVYLIRYAML